MTSLWENKNNKQKWRKCREEKKKRVAAKKRLKTNEHQPLQKKSKWWGSPELWEEREDIVQEVYVSSEEMNQHPYRTKRIIHATRTIHDTHTPKKKTHTHTHKKKKHVQHRCENNYQPCKAHNLGEITPHRTLIMTPYAVKNLWHKKLKQETSWKTARILLYESEEPTNALERETCTWTVIWEASWRWQKKKPLETSEPDNRTALSRDDLRHTFGRMIKRNIKRGNNVREYSDDDEEGSNS